MPPEIQYNRHLWTCSQPSVATHTRQLFTCSLPPKSHATDSCLHVRCPNPNVTGSSLHVYWPLQTHTTDNCVPVYHHLYTKALQTHAANSCVPVYCPKPHTTDSCIPVQSPVQRQLCTCLLPLQTAVYMFTAPLQTHTTDSCLLCTHLLLPCTHTQ